AGAAPNLSKGDVITLIDKVTGTFAKKTVTVDDYKFALSVNGGKLTATVTADPISGGDGGGGCNAAGLGFALLALAIPFVLKKRG
ncbi:MAG: SYNERG-CTERM sorting domain-containing protein, partial [Synergistaceae bacterium]|nr:SYNERG-CTERM sorting domain-containing protein [Synergistaceae bacterium]